MKNTTVGDRLAPALPPEPIALGAAALPKSIAAELAPKASEGLERSSACTVLAHGATAVLPIGSCHQILWFSFFFDGTGNNLDADLGTLKHSNVAKLFRAHLGAENIGGRTNSAFTVPGVYRVYIPGVGTYFPAINDDGGVAGGGFGRYGDKRIAWALDQLDKLVEKHTQHARNPSNRIVEMNISAFGFSRGAALARAFIHDLLSDHCERQRDSTFIYRKGGCRLRVRFMGLFDTVASSGLAASTNNINLIDAGIGSARTHIWVRLLLHAEARPYELAFARDGKPGADPCPGIWDGHKAFGSRLSIDPMVEDVRHFVAAHEYRNSFPLDSLSCRLKNSSYFKPAHFHEYVYPGAHSDVGGSYRAGEGGKNVDGTSKLGLIPLHAMYEFALKEAGVPFRAMSAFLQENRSDFSTNLQVRSDYDYYNEKVQKSAKLGELINAHMSLYYQWRFHAIRRQLNSGTKVNNVINANAALFRSEERILENNVEQLQAAYDHYRKIVTTKLSLMAQIGADTFLPEVGRQRMRDLQKAKESERNAYAALMRWKAKLATLPKEMDLVKITDLYDAQLVKDAKSIITCMGSDLVSLARLSPNINYASLRPHYRILVDAYRNEFELNRGLKDQRIIAFFDKYVHDSLSGFAKDGTLPSDPRVIYTGEDEKLPYASRNTGEADERKPVETRVA